MKIQEHELELYETIRLSGLTNMLEVTKVSMLTGLHRNKIMYIMENYDNLMDKLLLGDALC